MEMKTITYYKLRSPYPEDRTKNCGLTGEELDGNFFNLKSEVIKDAYWDKENKFLVLEKVDGTKIYVKGIVDGLDEFSFNYDSESGVLHVNAAGHNFDVEGFMTPDMINVTEIYSDNSINGNGTLENPLTVSPIIRTGVYKPAIKLIDTISAEEKLPNEAQVTKGDRYVTLERVSDYGLLYNFSSVKKIENDLRCQLSEWRIPTKDDWDGMLNAIEPCSEDKNHFSTSTNRALGKFAGKFLKSDKYWMLECEGCNNTCSPRRPCPDNCDCPSDMNPTPNKGLDSYGFRVMPAGYGDGGNVMDYFTQRAAFWTSSQLSVSDIYTKRFDYNRSSVYQEAVGPNMLLSLRLVKDYTGDNFNERETINGSDYTCVLMPDQNGKMKIWTVNNVNFSNPRYCGVEPNSGFSLTYEEKYFVNEWNGFGWMKHELKENESIILKLGPNGKQSQEWRVVNGSLRSIPDMVYNDVLSVVNKDINHLEDKIEDEKSRAQEAENTIATNLVNEVERAQKAENTIATNLVNEVERAQKAENTIATNLQNEAERAQNAENKLSSDLANEAERAQNAENKLSSDLANEVERAQNAENTIATNLANEVERAQNAENTIATNLANEVERAEGEEARIERKIDGEIERAKTEENKISDNLADIESKIDKEIEDRFNNDVKKDEKYIFKVNKGLILHTNDGSEITIEVDGNYGIY